jgi:hypothetical protein
VRVSRGRVRRGWWRKGRVRRGRYRKCWQWKSREDDGGRNSNDGIGRERQSERERERDSEREKQHLLIRNKTHSTILTSALYFGFFRAHHGLNMQSIVTWLIEYIATVISTVFQILLGLIWSLITPSNPRLDRRESERREEGWWEGRRGDEKEGGVMRRKEGWVEERGGSRKGGVIGGGRDKKEGWEEEGGSRRGEKWERRGERLGKGGYKEDCRER